MNNTKKIFGSVFLIYFICVLLRLFEYFILRTDTSVIGEAVFHKIAGIVILIFTCRLFGYSPADVSFEKNNAGYRLFTGIIFGLICFAVAYIVEIIILCKAGSYQSLGLYVTSYSISGNLGNQTAFGFFVLCFAGNAINVIMEEGVFRGLFIKRIQEKYAYSVAAVISAVLFAFWHGVAPVRSFLDGDINGFQLFMNCLILILSSGVVGFKYGLITKITGSGFMAMGDHFVNNTLVNILHVVSEGGADTYQIIRISIAQTLSFIIVLIWYFYSKKNNPVEVPVSTEGSNT